MTVDYSKVVIFVTCSSEEEAEKIVSTLMDRHLVACGNVIPKVTSIFRWEGEVCREGEVLVILKSQKSLLDKIVLTVKEHHSYQVPEIIAVPIVGGSEDYLKWVEAETR